MIVTYAFSDGELLFDPTVPIEDAIGTIHAPVVSLLLRIRFLRPLREHHRLGPVPASVISAAPCSGRIAQCTAQGFADLPIRFAVNLVGGPALAARGIRQDDRRRATTLGASVKVIAPTGQYNPEFAINIGTQSMELQARDWLHAPCRSDDARHVRGRLVLHRERPLLHRRGRRSATPGRRSRSARSSFTSATTCGRDCGSRRTSTTGAAARRASMA